MRKYLLLAFFSLISLQIANAQCAILGATTVTVLSGSGNGTPGSPYSSGAVLRYCITIDEYFEDQTNWLHGVYMFPASLPAGATVDSSGNPGSTWIWYSGGCNGRPAGWYFDEDADNDPCNNFGDDPCGDDPAGPCGRTFCFKITIPLTGTGVAQQIQVKVTGDGTTGSWINSGCDDPPVNVGPPFSWGGAPSCPTLTVAPNVTITDNACPSGCSPIRTGTINTGSANCPSGSELRWFTNATTTTGGVTTTPTYAAATSYFARCVCTSDNTVLSPVTTITSAAACPADTTGPTISCPANATISGCFTTQTAALAAIPAANTNLVTATDPNGPINITHVGDALPINTIGCTYIVQRTYRATDICNNFSECNQIFTFFQGCTYVTTCSSVNNTRCVAPFNGSASVTTDASSPTYLWSNGATTSSISDLAAGTYTVSVTEALSGCTSTCSTTITDNIVTPTVTCQSTNNTNCSGAGNGTATATSTGVTYLWNDGSTNASISGLSGGAYTVTVTSTTTGCTATCSATINNPELPTVSCLSTNNTNCTGAGNGTATATSTGVTYLWSNGSTNPSLSGLSGGTYTVTVTSINSGCTASCSTTLGDPTIPTVSCSSTNNTNCTGGGNGTATANSTGVTFLWSTGSTNAAIIGLSAGTYTVTVTRLGSGCTATCSAIVENPIVPAVTCSSTNNTACSGAGNGTASATSTGVTYSWSNGSTNPNLTGLSGGTYTVIVTSTTSGCTATCSATITNPAVPAVICSSTNNTNCTNPNGTASATATNANYLWSNGSTGASLSGLSAGTYTVIVTDLTTGCTASCTSVVGTSTVNPSVTCSATDNTSCTNPNGTASATATNVSYSWSNGSTRAPISGLSAGTYTVIVTDFTTGCTASCTSVVGTNTINPSVTCSSTDNTNCTTPNGTASATATNVSYSWSNGSTSASISGLSAGTYTVIVTDLTTGCTASCTSVVGTNTVNPSVTCTATDNTNCTTPNGTASATATNVSYSWSNGSTSASISGLSAGTYTVIVTDLTTGCTASCASVVGTNTVNPNVTCSATDNTNCTTPNGTASATATNVTYSWSNGATTSSISGLIAGVYIVIVTDISTGCTSTCSSNIASNTSNPTVTCSATDNTNCSGAGDGTASATASM
nr:hypothetical protein [Bacteroidota bacterium]